MTFMPLVQERLMSCTGDPELRFHACWDCWPRGTLLDFGWTRENKDMPKAWSFFAYCKPEDLLTCLVEIMDTITEFENQLAGEWVYPRFQPWKLITVGQVLHCLYRKRILVEPQSPDKIKYMEHVLERSNIRGLQVKLTQKIWSETELDDVDYVDEVEFLLSLRLSELATLALRPEDNLIPYCYFGPTDAEVFNPRHLRLNLLVGVGGLKIEWTEDLHEHLTLNASTLTVYIFWFASHIRQNSMFQMYCDLFDCKLDHAKIGQPSMSRLSMSYRKQILRSYLWIFHELASSSSRREAYYDLPLPWWLAPLQSAQQQQVPTKTSVKGLFVWLGKALNALATLLHFKMPRPKEPYGTIRSLLKDGIGRKCKLPIDCLLQLRPFNNERTEIAEGGQISELYEDDSDDEEESLGVTHQVSYQLYPALAPRIKILIEHLEKQKPKGFDALWKDQRDSNTWYTFWAAVISGVTALVPAAGSLAVSAAQTWAIFRAVYMWHER
ncbi:hypothetical protein BKA58DRAFT_459455 [Alternaria rosae]|uniref:uncharacterized protein n=1 Tax=Alternaria rosae TaxID=1187941 RepID=UPI001E8ECC3B|nr:uncharacterized protein BKA58DRAFT_459455 [Alternaria rosae]KAH6868587.1 hypothetical protein BKA58DRAFT_459455 [Alternaria rosae]